jgi:hypothetical protein
MSPPVRLRQLVILIVGFVDHRPPALRKQPVFSDHDSEGGVIRVVARIHKAEFKVFKRRVREANTIGATSDHSVAPAKALIVDYLLEAKKRIVVCFSACEMDEVFTYI